MELSKDHKNDFSDMVAHTLQQVLGQDHEDMHSQLSLEDHLAASEELSDLDNDAFLPPHNIQRRTDGRSVTNFIF